MKRNALAALLAAPFLALAVQSPAEALFRGDEFERREFKLEREYFLDILSYLPSFETELRYRGADKAYLVGSGSINSNELFIWQRL